LAETKEMGKADLHVHTAFSDGMADARAVLEYVEAHTDLDVLAITDHDDVRGALKAREIWARGHYRFELVTGAELTTIEGHLLALFVEEPLELEKTGDFEQDVRAGTLEFLGRFEKRLRADPGQWAVLERVWDGVASSK
jgi:predicted metal-dependent phosphoesterase TrpH